MSLRGTGGKPVPAAVSRCRISWRVEKTEVAENTSLQKRHKRSNRACTGQIPAKNLEWQEWDGFVQRFVQRESGPRSSPSFPRNAAQMHEKRQRVTLNYMVGALQKT